MNAEPARTILVVEDDPMLRELLAYMVSAQGYEVVEAADGGEAIQALDQQEARHPFSLVLLDVMLPGIDGLDVLRHRAERGYAVPIVAMSASHAHLAAAEQAGAQVALAKPFEMAQLLGLLEQQLPPRS